MRAPRIKKVFDVLYPIPLNFILSFAINEAGYQEPDLLAIRCNRLLAIHLLISIFTVAAIFSQIDAGNC